MSIDGKLSKKGLQQLLAGRVTRPANIFVKFYSNSCHYCRNLQDIYLELAEDNPEFEFWVFDIASYPEVQRVLDFNGIPTFCTIKVGTLAPRIRVMDDPETPHKKSYYTKSYIQKFLNKEKEK